MFILLHRLTAILSPLAFERWWRKLLPLSIAVTLFSPLPITWVIFARHYVVHYSDGSNTTFSEDVLLPAGSPDLDSFDPRAAGYSSALFCVVCAAINIACVVLYRRIKSRQTSKMTCEPTYNQNFEERGIQYRLAVYAFVTFLAQLLMAIVMLNIYISVVVNSDFFFFLHVNQLPLVNVSRRRRGSGHPTITE